MASIDIDKMFGQCRCCLKQDYHKDFTESDYKDVFRDCFNLILSTNTKLSNLICTECVSQIDDAVQFKEMVVQSEQQLLSAISDNEADGCNELDIKSETDEVKEEFEESSCEDDHAEDDNDEPEPETEAEDCGVGNQPDNGSPQIAERELKQNETSEHQTMEDIAAGINASSSSKDTNNLTLERSKKENLIYLEENEKEMRSETYVKFSNENKYQLSKVQIQRNDSKCKRYSCTICKYTANTARLINTHLQAHSSANKFICDSCSYIAAKKKVLIRHLNICDKLYVCKICDKKFARSYDLKRHVKINTSEKPFACINVHTGEKPYACNICDKIFTRSSSLKAHINMHTGEKPFACKICGKKLTTKYNVIDHMKMHTGEKLFACKTCGKKLTTKYNVIHHMKIHTGEKPYVCNVCNKKFPKVSDLNSHIKIHTGEKPYACKICDKKFRLKCTFDYHIKIHLGKKPHVCDICGKKFAQSSHLKLHVKIHSGEKPHICDICGKKFTRKSHLDRHVNTRKTSCA